MTSTQIKAFLQIVDEGNLSKAAEYLFITQPALSRIIKALENNLGGKLFDRQHGKESMKLTDFGEAFLPIAEKWQQLSTEAYELRQHLQQQKYTITATDSLNTCFFPVIYEKLLAQNPFISLRIRSHHTLDSYMDLEQGRADIGFVSTVRHSKKVESILVFQEKMLIIYDKHRHFPDMLSPDELDPTEEIRIPWSPEYEAWHNYWFAPSIASRVLVDKISIVAEFLLSSKSWAIVPITAADYLCKNDQFNTSELINGPNDRKCYCISRKDRKEKLHNILLALINEHIKDMSGITSIQV